MIKYCQAKIALKSFFINQLILYKNFIYFSELELTENEFISSYFLESFNNCTRQYKIGGFW